MDVRGTFNGGYQKSTFVATPLECQTSYSTFQLVSVDTCNRRPGLSRIDLELKPTAKLINVIFYVANPL